MMDWVRAYSMADLTPFIEFLDKTQSQYYPDEIDMLKDAVSITGISMTNVLNKAVKVKKPDHPDLYAPGQPCTHKCKDNCPRLACKACKQIKAK